MGNKSYWIWHYGEYEIFHVMNVHLKREERGMHIPAFWKIATPYATVKFRKDIKCEGGYIKCHINGMGYLTINAKRYPLNKRIDVAPGSYTVEVHASNYGGLPAAFIESDICPSNDSWKSNCYAGEFYPVGYNAYFDSLSKNPEQFPFEYKNILPISFEKIESGFLYDFGTEVFGYLNINNAEKNREITVFYGESKEEAVDTEYSYLTDCVSLKTDYRLRQRAFRYVFIKGIDEKVNVSVDYEYLPLETKGSFKSDNKLLNEIFTSAAYTFHLNCREAFLDGVKRDRWVWAGDVYQSARINRYLFADKEIEQRTLMGLIGKKPIEQHINTIVDYSLFWIIALYEHYMIYGDRLFLSRIYPMAEELLDFCEKRLNKDGFIEGIKGDWTFIDWSEMEKEGAVCAEQMLFIKVYSVMAFFAKEFKTGKEDLFIKKSLELKKRTNQYFWSDEKGAFIDSYKSGNAHVTRHANIFAVMYDIATKEQQDSIFQNVLKNDNITKITTPYFEGYELDALAKLGDFETIEEKLTSYWGGMLKLGAKTIWEEYSPSMNGVEHYAMYGGKYEKSLCHAWGAGPIYLFGRYYLGVYPTSCGYKTFVVEPKTGGLDEICGTVPINDGLVTVKLNKKRLSVMATKSGGTLIWKGQKYDLTPKEEFILDL